MEPLNPAWAKLSDAPEVQFIVHLDTNVSRRQFWHVIKDRQNNRLWSGPRFADAISWLLTKDAQDIAFVTALDLVALKVTWSRPIE